MRTWQPRRKNRLTTEAEGRAAAIRAQGEAEASIIFQKGEAEAKAMSVKAEAYQEWNQAAVVDKLLTNMADVVRAMAEPLSKVDKITIVSTGNDDAAGAHKITGDMTQDCGAGAGIVRGAERHGHQAVDVQCAGDEAEAGERRGDERRQPLNPTRLRVRHAEPGHCQTRRL